MVAKLVILFCLIVFITLETVYGAPYEPKTDLELTKSFINFLKQDKTILTALHKINVGDKDYFERQKRETEEESLDADVNPGNNTEGFFDRAAKFVMEVLQRFLKWINTDN